MATQNATDAIVFPQDPGTGLPKIDDPSSAALWGLLSQYPGRDVVNIDYAGGMSFSRDASNDTITVGSGLCWVTDDSASTSNDRGASGNPSIQSVDDGSQPPTYDTELPGGTVYAVVLPSSVTVSVSDSTLSSIWLNITGVDSNNAVEIRSGSGGGTTTAPSDTYLKIGEANADDSSQDVRSNDWSAPKVVASGVETLSSGTASTDTGISSSNKHYSVRPSPRSGADIAFSLEDDSGTGNWTIYWSENNTTVGNPDVGWQLVEHW